MISSKQRSILKSYANKIEPIFQLGKGGITDNFVKQVSDALEARELVKFTVLKNADYTAKIALNEICEKTGAEPVCALGNRVIVYRKSKTKKEHIEI